MKKNIIKLGLVFTLGSFLMISCDKDDDDTVEMEQQDEQVQLFA